MGPLMGTKWGPRGVSGWNEVGDGAKNNAPIVKERGTNERLGWVDL